MRKRRINQKKKAQPAEIDPLGLEADAHEAQQSGMGPQPAKMGAQSAEKKAKANPRNALDPEIESRFRAHLGRGPDYIAQVKRDPYRWAQTLMDTAQHMRQVYMNASEEAQLAKSQDCERTGAREQTPESLTTSFENLKVEERTSKHDPARPWEGQTDWDDHYIEAYRWECFEFCMHMIRGLDAKNKNKK